MKNRLVRICAIVFLVVAVLSMGAGCGKKETTTTQSPDKPPAQSYSGGLVTAVANAATVEKRTQAVKDIVEKGFSLGLLDENAEQLNSNVPEDAISLSPGSAENYANLEASGYFRTVEYVVGFLADAGVELESTGAVITLKDFLPDLQKYVNWSFSHTDDPQSILGLMIASGADLKVPASAPTITGQTMITPLCSLMIMGDVLIGVRDGAEKASAAKGNWLVKKAYADDGSDESIQKIRGLISIIKKSDILMSLLPEKAMRILAAFEACDRLSMRMWEVPASSISGNNWNNTLPATLPAAKTFKLEKGKTESITILGGAGLMAGVSGSPMETLEGVQTSYRFQLVSDDEQGTGVPLYDDVDAELKGYADGLKDNFTYSPDLNGHRLAVQGKGNTPFVLATKTMSNGETRRALLHASAVISPPDDLYNIAVQRMEQKLGNSKVTKFGALFALGLLPWDDIKKTMEILKRDFQPTPWMCFVEFGPVEMKTTSNTTTTQAQKPGPPQVRITSPKDGATIMEGEKIVVSITANDYLGQPLAENYVDSNAQWKYDDGSSLSCSPLGDGDFEVSTKLPTGPHKITVSIKTKDEKGVATLEGSDYVNITIVPQQLSALETVLKKNWTLVLNRGGKTAEYQMSFRDDGTFSFMNDAWENTWTLSGSSIKMNMSYDYKSGPNMVKRMELTGTLAASTDGDYRKATMQGNFTEWNDWEKDKSMQAGTWTAK
jgi:hypothetical protein